MLSEQEIDTLFMNVEQILEHHLTFLPLIKDRVTNWTGVSLIGDLFVNKVIIELKSFFLIPHKK